MSRCGHNTAAAIIHDLLYNSSEQSWSLAMATIVGTIARDQLTGTGGADTISGLDSSDVINGGDGNDTIYGFGSQDVDPNAGLIQAHELTTGLALPVFGASPPGQPGTMYVIEQHTGKVQIVDLATGAVSATPFLDISDSQISTGNEQGLLGLAFSPNYATDGKLYVDLTNA